MLVSRLLSVSWVFCFLCKSSSGKECSISFALWPEKSVSYKWGCLVHPLMSHLIMWCCQYCFFILHRQDQLNFDCCFAFQTPPLSSLSLSHTCISHFVSLVRDLSCWPLGFVPDCRSRTITNALIFFLGSTNSFSWNGQKCWVINLYILSYKRHEPYHVSAFFSMHYLIMVPISTDILDNLSALLFYLPG